MNCEALPRVLLLSLGGTIAMQPGAGAGVVPRLSGESLVASVPAIGEVAQVEARSFRQLPGAHLGFDDMEALADAIREAADRGVHGVVVTQGTDTIEETAFVLDRLLHLQIPVVVTGAMRNPTVPGADGPANLLTSIQVAASPEARGLGCVVVFNDEVHSARFVRKMHTSSVGTFASPNAGPLGWLVEGRLRIALRAPAMAALDAVDVPPRIARVALATVALGDDGSALKALRECGAFDGLVVEAVGGGHVPPGVAHEIEQAAKSIPVVLATRTSAGETLANTYGFEGGEIDLQRRGAIRSGWLDGVKARLLLTLLLRRGVKTQEQVNQAFAPWGGGEIV